MEPPAIGPKMKMIEQKVFLKLWKMFSGFLMTLNTHGINEGSKEDKPDEAKVKEREKEKGKAEEEEDTSSQEDPKAEEKEEEKAALTWWEKKDIKKTGKKKKIGMIPGTKAIGPMIKTGMMAIGPQKNCTTRMSMVVSRRKEKERKERKVRKARMMKEKANQKMEKASQTMSSLKLHRILPFKSNNNGLIILLQRPARVDVLSANYGEYHGRTRRGGTSTRCSGTTEQRSQEEVSCLSWRS